jgi:hypothetical protein
VAQTETLPPLPPATPPPSALADPPVPPFAFTVPLPASAPAVIQIDPPAPEPLYS